MSNLNQGHSGYVAVTGVIVIFRFNERTSINLRKIVSDLYPYYG